MTFILETNQLSKRYGTNWALRACNLQIPAGRIVGLVGPNGAGKTTLLHLAMGLLDPTTGSIQILGKSPLAHPDEVLAQVGFVAQSRPLYKNFRVAQHLEFGARLNRSWDDARARERLTRYEIELDRKVGSLSGGQQAQLSLALALSKRPQLLLLDEPLASLDPLARQDFLRTLLVAATEEHLTVLFSSHVVAELERVCDYVVLLAQGRVQLSGDVDTLLAAHRRLTRSMDEQIELEDLPGVVSLTRDERAITMLVQTTAKVNRLGWEERAVTLEELILAYMARPTVTLPISVRELEKEDTRA